MPEIVKAGSINKVKEMPTHYKAPPCHPHPHRTGTHEQGPPGVIGAIADGEKYRYLHCEPNIKIYKIALIILIVLQYHFGQARAPIQEQGLLPVNCA